ncbi:MAG: Gfo/Idh/MocA family oxidoreductase [Planctomycetota bacterium]|nr:Gfo/Idh/MocA family oxidoreductase [Planctomycetota bacterium]
MRDPLVRTAGIPAGGTIFRPALDARAAPGYERNMSNARVAWGLLGCGSFLRRRVLPVFKASAHARAVALQRRDLAQALATAKEAGVPRAYASREELLADAEVQAVFVATPNAAHLDDVLACAAAGKHVLVEKPMSVDAAACARMIEACAKAGVRLFVGHCFRYQHAVEQARALLAAGELGELQSVRGHYSFLCKPGVWRLDAKLSGGGPLMDLAPHLLDFFLHLTGQDVVEAHAVVEPARDLAGGRCEERAKAVLRLAGGALATLEVSFNEPFRNGFEVLGTKGSLRGDYTLSLLDNPNVRLDRFSSDPTPPAVSPVPLERREIYRMQVDDVSRAILDPAHRPLCATGADGLRVLKVIDAIYASGQRGERVRI